MRNETIREITFAFMRDDRLQSEAEQSSRYLAKFQKTKNIFRLTNSCLNAFAFKIDYLE